jgi:hypothetical protein
MPTVVAHSNPIRNRCLGWGSQLGGRYQGVRSWGAKLVREWRCGCGRRRRVGVAGR